ncbi:MAG: hypothetical protein EOR68_26190 [Mesorhizobium sp.]|nr:hypothetical protein [Mesorhizobium sp.]RWL92545.1 MAG: hypothetical protein EOR68_26190 [Mesorhizobium sp.]TIP41247.1 MAG: hypothetical protein E5X77_26315 [Mesorhizobium sp.]TJV68163.1 MAG: hypothetical protein E5X76_30800 [Mesorhizobium sp.]
MRPIGSTIILASTTLASLAASVVGTQASEWGCEVLLCASSSNPSWHGVPACHPPMDRLISAMSGWGFSWPTCPEAGAGPPGYEKYADCPAGWSVGYSEVGHGMRSEPDLCVQKGRNTCSRREGCSDTISMPRPSRGDPYYFDISAKDGSVSRHWFNLRR